MSNIDRFFAGSSVSGGGISGEQVFTASGNFTVPNGVYVIYVSGCGGGGGGPSGYVSAGASVNAGGSDGPNSAVCALFVPVKVTPGEIIPITVGAKGIGNIGPTTRNSHAVSGSAGGDSKVKNIILPGGDVSGRKTQGPQALIGLDATFGHATGSSAPSSNSVTGTRYQSRSINSVEYPVATSGQAINQIAAGSGAGGSSYFGKGGDGRDPVENANSANGENATGYGAGGGGGGNIYNASTNRKAGNGGDGSPGIIIINW